MNDEFDASEKWGGKGFYIALLLCISVIALSAWIILAAGSDGQEAMEADGLTGQDAAETVDNVWGDGNETGDVLSPDTPDIVETLATPEPETAETDAGLAENTAEVMSQTEPVSQPAAEPAEETLNTGVYLWPVVGELEADYSMDALAYNVTMADWRTHDGIDIAAAAGTVVKAAAGGVVESVYTDDLYGTTVVINHGDGLKSCYANRQEVPAVAEGNRVSAGDTIGAVGRTALCETAEPYHLHLSMSLNGESVNPRDYLPQL